MTEKIKTFILLCSGETVSAGTALCSSLFVMDKSDYPEFRFGDSTKKDMYVKDEHSCGRRKQ